MYTVGVDIGGTKIKIGLVTPAGEIEAQSKIPTIAEKGYAFIVAEICGEIKRMLAVRAVKGIGVGIPGIADSSSGIVRTAINLRWRDVRLASEFQKYFPVPVKISNDANCAALGEQRFGSARGHQNMVFITIGTGVGSGIVVDGKLVEGQGSAGAEAGHILIKIDGEKCACGRRGCWEAYASASALIKQTVKAIAKNPRSLLAQIAEGAPKISGKTAFMAKERGCPAGAGVVEKYQRYLAEGLISLANVLHPEVFVIGGGMSHEGDVLIKPVEKYLNDYLRCVGLLPAISVIPASLGNAAGLLGAAALLL